MLRRALQRFNKQNPDQQAPEKTWNDSPESSSFVSKIRRQYRIREVIFENIWILRYARLEKLQKDTHQIADRRRISVGRS